MKCGFSTSTLKRFMAGRPRRLGASRSLLLHVRIVFLLLILSSGAAAASVCSSAVYGTLCFGSLSR